MKLNREIIIALNKAAIFVTLLTSGGCAVNLTCAKPGHPEVIAYDKKVVIKCAGASMPEVTVNGDSVVMPCDKEK